MVAFFDLLVYASYFWPLITTMSEGAWVSNGALCASNASLLSIAASPETKRALAVGDRGIGLSIRQSLCYDLRVPLIAKPFAPAGKGGGFVTRDCLLSGCCLV